MTEEHKSMLSAAISQDGLQGVLAEMADIMEGRIEDVDRYIGYQVNGRAAERRDWVTAVRVNIRRLRHWSEIIEADNNRV